VLEHSEVSLLFVGKLYAWEQQRDAVPAGLPCIALPLSPATACATWDAIVAHTPPLAGRPQRGADELALLLYTSGSTGQPKGVMQSFRSITAVAEGIAKRHVDRYGPDLPLRVLSYLPLAHCYERAWVECFSFVRGTAQVFFTEALPTFMDDMRRAKPTLFFSVPRLWTKFQQTVLAQMPAAQLDAMLENPAMAAAVGKKVLTGLGLEHVVVAGSGSAPLPVELLVWYRKLGLNLIEGYSMTEDFGYSHCTRAGEERPGYVGQPLDEVQVRVAEDGEILIKSPGSMMGYYKQPDLNAKAFTTEGFFRTGDLGEYDGEGRLKLTGRKKELFKTAKGEYVAPAPIENRLNAHAMVELSIVSGVGQPAAYTVVVLDEFLRPRTADPEVRARVEAELAKLLDEVNTNLGSHERLRFLVVAREPWSIANGMLTPTMKLKRSRIEAAVAPQVEGWFAAQGSVLWA
jgi:long-chain acyl-CoA synthetase